MAKADKTSKMKRLDETDIDALVRRLKKAERRGHRAGTAEVLLIKEEYGAEVTVIAILEVMRRGVEYYYNRSGQLPDLKFQLDAIDKALKDDVRKYRRKKLKVIQGDRK